MSDDDPPLDPESDRAPAITVIDAASRLTDVIAADPTAIERLAVIDAAFRDVASDPEGASSLGPTLADAAERLGIPATALIAAVTGEAPSACVAADRGEELCEVPPDWLVHFQETAATTIDVRPMLAAGRDPFATVMAVAASISPGGGLVIDAPFNPLPLRRVLGRRGFATFGRRVTAVHWRIVCCRQAAAKSAEPSASLSSDGARVWQSADGVHVDVRGLPAPKPLAHILALIDSGKHQGVVIVHHQREPAYLFPELAEREWDYAFLESDPGEVRLRLSRRAH